MQQIFWVFWKCCLCPQQKSENNCRKTESSWICLQYVECIVEAFHICSQWVFQQFNVFFFQQFSAYFNNSVFSSAVNVFQQYNGMKGSKNSSWCTTHRIALFQCFSNVPCGWKGARKAAGAPTPTPTTEPSRTVYQAPPGFAGSCKLAAEQTVSSVNFVFGTENVVHHFFWWWNMKRYKYSFKCVSTLELSAWFS